MTDKTLKDVIAEGDQTKIEQTIRDSVRESIRYETDGQAELDESIGITIAGLVALGSTWPWVRGMLRQYDNEKLLGAFLETHDPEKIIERKLPEAIRRFKLVRTLTDLEAMETTIERYLNQMKGMTNRVDSFVDMAYRDEKTLGDKVFARNPQKEKQKLKRFIQNFIKETEKSFNIEVENKKDEILS